MHVTYTTNRRTPRLPMPRPGTCRTTDLARHLDLLAGIELAHGHGDAAERLAWRADAIRREGAR